MQLTEKWAKGYKAHLMEVIAPLSPGVPLLRWVGVFMAIMAAGSFTLLVSMLLLVWKVKRGCVKTQTAVVTTERTVLLSPALRH